MWRHRIAGPPEVLSEHFIDKKLKTRIADAVLRAPLKGGGELVVYVIVEHKREEAAEDLLQVGQYVLDLYRWLLAKHGVPMPPVVPLIIYNGRVPWRGARSFHELIDVAGNTR